MKNTSLPSPSLNPKELLQALHSIRDWRRMIVTSLSKVRPDQPNAAAISHGHGSQSAEGEALQVLSWITRIHPLELEKHLDAKLCEAEKVQILDKIQQRLQTRLPMAYLLGEAWFGNLRLKSDARALVPRSLILEALNQTLWDALEQFAPNYSERLLSQSAEQGLRPTDVKPLRILDLCTGGGSIAIKAALDFPTAQVTGSDLSFDALALAQENIQLFGLDQQIELHQGHLFAGLTGKFDLMLCNPPYVNEESMEALPAEFQAEPRIALAGGNDGMDLIRDILAEAPNYLEDDAYLLLEIGHEARYFEAAFAWLNFSYVPVAAGANMLVLVSQADLISFAEAEKGNYQSQGRNENND
jgi:ribosomal protein L3 glutamine methyltransferase